MAAEAKPATRPRERPKNPREPDSPRLLPTRLLTRRSPTEWFSRHSSWFRQGLASRNSSHSLSCCVLPASHLTRSRRDTARSRMREHHRYRQHSACRVVQATITACSVINSPTSAGNVANSFVTTPAQFSAKTAAAHHAGRAVPEHLIPSCPENAIRYSPRLPGLPLYVIPLPPLRNGSARNPET